MPTVDESVDHIVADYASGHRARPAFRDIEAATADVPWTELRIEVDRDGQRRARFQTEQPMRLLDDSASDPTGTRCTTTWG